MKMMNIDITMVICLENDWPGMNYVSWMRSSNCSANTIACPLKLDKDDVIFISAFKMESIGESGAELGVLEFKRTDEKLSLADIDLTMVIGNVLSVTGEEMRLEGINFQEIPVYRNYLSNNYPNPFNPTTRIDYSIARDSHVNLSIYNVNGQLVRTLVDEFKVKNAYTVNWDGKNNLGVPVASGVYFYQMRSEGFTQAKKLVLLR